jgi:hypothetical protein
VDTVRRSVPRLDRLHTRHVWPDLDCVRGSTQPFPLVLAGWLDRRKRDALAYLMDENRMLRRPSPDRAYPYHAPNANAHAERFVRSIKQPVASPTCATWRPPEYYARAA